MFHVKHQPSNIKELHTLASAVGVIVSAEQADALLTYLDLLLEKNRMLNLTRITDYDEALRLHIVDSLAPLPYLGLDVSQVFADLGTGGGLPGIPLAIMAGAHGVLVDSVKKKAAAVEEFIRTLSLEEQLRVYSGRAEELALRSEERNFDLVIARALSSLPSLLELASPLLRNGGILASMKGAPDSEELASAEAVADLLGYTCISVDILKLPHGEENRVLYRYQKTGEPSVSLPRRVGKAQKTPLA